MVSKAQASLLLRAKEVATSKIKAVASRLDAAQFKAKHPALHEAVKEAAASKVKKEAKLKAKRVAELKAKAVAEYLAKEAAKLKAKRAAELKAKKAALLKAEKLAAAAKAKNEAKNNVSLFRKLYNAIDKYPSVLFATFGAIAAVVFGFSPPLIFSGVFLGIECVYKVREIVARKAIKKLMNIGACKLIITGRYEFIENAQTISYHQYFDEGKRAENDSWEYAKSCIFSPKTYIPGTNAFLAFQAGREAASFQAEADDIRNGMASLDAHMARNDYLEALKASRN